MSAFEDLQRQLQKAKDKVRKRAAEAADAIASLAKNNEYKRTVQKQAESMQELLSDTRYADMRDYLTSLRNANQKAMEVSATQDAGMYEMSIAVARYGAKVELINNILEYPGRCIAILRQTEKEAARRNDK